jgi:hypothetical protein
MTFIQLWMLWAFIGFNGPMSAKTTTPLAAAVTVVKIQPTIPMPPHCRHRP